MQVGNKQGNFGLISVTCADNNGLEGTIQYETVYVLADINNTLSGV